MMSDEYLNRKNSHLILSALILLMASLMYGLYPEQFLPRLFHVDIESIDLRNIFRAIMCLYLGVVFIFILGVIKPEYWKFATLLLIVFMGSLAMGRLISYIVDGKPSLLFILGFFGELILALFSYWQLSKYIK